MSVALNPEELLHTALAAWERRTPDFPGCLEALPAPLYVTDPDGLLTFYNTACVAFAGRVPVPRQDRWCVTWKLFTESGEPMPHDRCPMATAIRERRPVRGQTAVAERPDGARIAFRPYPTPLFDAAGAFAGAVNLLHDITGLRRREHLEGQALKCRRLAQSIGDRQTAEALERLARAYDAQAASL